MILLSISILLLLLSVPLCRAQTIDTTPVSEFNIERYMGKWYEIARFDNRFERYLTDVTAEYSISDNNTIALINRGFHTQDKEWKEAHGKGEMTSVRGQFKVSFFILFSNEYNVLGLGDNYEWALVGSKSSKYLWILSRTPTLAHDTLHHIIALAKERGYDVDRLNIIQREQMAQR